MGIVLRFADWCHTATPAAGVIPNKAGSARLFNAAKASENTRYNSAGMRPRERQLLTADEPKPVKVATARVPPKASMMSPTVSNMPGECSRFVNKSSLHRMPIVTDCELLPNWGMSRSLKDIASRLEVTREALGLTAADLCRQTGIKPNQWSQFVNPTKKRRITLDAAYKLRDEYGISLDWIYDGDPSNLPARLHSKISAKVA